MQSSADLDRIGLAPDDGRRQVVHLRNALVEEESELRTTVLPSVLGRWARDHAARGLEVVLVPLHEDDVRVGIRRVRAAPDEARAALEARARELGLVPHAVMPRRTPLRRMLDALNRDVAIFVVDRRGRIVARQTGRATLDPRALEEAVQRVATR